MSAAAATGPWNRAAGRIRIVRRPDGEAPDWVRDAWIGVELDLVYSKPLTSEGFGVLSAPRTVWGYWWRRLTGRIQRFTGYVVDSHEAVRRVEALSPAAAAWWRDNAGDLVRPGETFIFDLPACEKID